MAKPRLDPYEVAVVGGGPAGIAAAVTAAERLGPGRVLLVDDNAAPGGQIWRQGVSAAPAAARVWLERLERSGVRIESGAAVIDARREPDAFALFAERDDQLLVLRGRRLVLALGAVEVFLPFPGWTLPGVFGAGGLQAMVKSGLDVRRKRVVVAGSGPLLLAVAALLRERGAHVLAIAEQADRARVWRFAARLASKPGKALQAAALGLRLLAVRQHYATWPARAEGRGALERVVLRGPDGGGRSYDCDLLAAGFGLAPTTGLARLLGCQVAHGRISVGDDLQTSVPGIYGAGESLGIGGVDRALLDGRIAGLAAAGHASDTDLAARRGEERFGDALAEAFALREELRAVDDATIVCRCEDVTWGQIRRHFTIRDAKLKTRCGMGPCQGRVCGGALEFLAGFQQDTVRPPLSPVSLRVLAQLGAFQKGNDHD
jgi:NADPH-dependent 2,4-dienoyl-CoA reductase/sulfur reductase-like enzyme